MIVMGYDGARSRMVLSGDHVQLTGSANLSATTWVQRVDTETVSPESADSTPERGLGSQPLAQEARVPIRADA
jgi:hypothetical protein